MQGRDGWGWGALTKGGRGVRKEEEEERNKLGEKGELIPWDNQQTTGDQKRGNPRTLWLVFDREHPVIARV